MLSSLFMVFCWKFLHEVTPFACAIVRGDLMAKRENAPANNEAMVLERLFACGPSRTAAFVDGSLALRIPRGIAFCAGLVSQTERVCSVRPEPLARFGLTAPTVRHPRRCGGAARCRAGANRGRCGQRCRDRNWPKGIPGLGLCAIRLRATAGCGAGVPVGDSNVGPQ